VTDAVPTRAGSLAGSPPLALGGLRVLDLSQHATGPFATQIMAALGASVVKVEQPPHGDRERFTEPEMFLACNRGKYSIALNLKADGDRSVLRGLIKDADVFVEGFRPGVADRLGVGYPEVSALQPRIIYVSMPGFGSAGPLAHAPGYDVEFRALAGDLALNADASGTPQYARASPAFDYAAALYATIGVLTTLLAPQRAAVRLEVPILAAGLAFSFARLIDSRYEPGQDEHRWQHLYRCADGRFVSITAGQDAQFRALCDAIGLAGLADREDLGTIAGRHAAAAEVNERIAAAVATQTLAVWRGRLDAAGIPWAPVLNPAEVFEHPQVQALGVVHQAPSPHADLPVFGLPSRSLVTPPELDEHGAVLRTDGWSGLDR
jgi:crotonobetainyl-CoA:carnitine CoA-transferase CaiB-like acyl-CoA transferase